METSTIDYSQHRPNDFNWVNTYISDMGKQNFHTFLNRVFGRLMKMQVGETYDLTKKVSAENRDLFIKVACYYIQCGNIDYYFSNDYTVIYRHEKQNIKEIIQAISQKKMKKELKQSNI